MKWVHVSGWKNLPFYLTIAIICGFLDFKEAGLAKRPAFQWNLIFDDSARSRRALGVSVQSIHHHCHTCESNRDFQLKGQFELLSFRLSIWLSGREEKGI